MCRIAGCWSEDKELASNWMDSTLKSLRHGGPDGQHYVERGKLILGHARLAIQDLSAQSNQPMSLDDSLLTFNGEVYNYESLRLSLEKRGAFFVTKGDTEVLLQGLVSYGLDFLSEVEGMFALAYFLGNELYLIRDRLGVKPLYYTVTESGLFFSSELAPLYKLVGPSLKISKEGVREYLSKGYLDIGENVLSGIREVPAGCAVKYSIEDGSISVVKYFDVVSHTDSIRMNKNYKKVELSNALVSSIQERLVSDVPVCMLLSSGIDSSVLAAMLKQNGVKNLDTFTIDMGGTDKSEAENAQVISSYCGFNHNDVIFDLKDFKEYYDQWKGHNDELNSAPSILPMLKLFETISSKYKVVLTADGGDEFFGGYEKYRVFRFMNILNYFSIGTKRLFLLIFKALVSSRSNKMHLQHKFERILFAQKDNLIDALDANVNVDLVLDRPEVLNSNRSSHVKSVRQYRLWDIQNFMKNEVLKKVDRTSMRYGVEAREPFLGMALLNYAFSLNESSLISLTRTKIPLRHLAKSFYPKKISNLPKRGFTVPIHLWMKECCTRDLESLICSDRFFDFAQINKKNTEQLVTNYLSGSSENYMLVWNILVLYNWWSLWIKSH